jgi:hypothetical protein
MSSLDLITQELKERMDYHPSYKRSKSKNCPKKTRYQFVDDGTEFIKQSGKNM